jgi:hypothetical protein
MIGSDGRLSGQAEHRPHETQAPPRAPAQHPSCAGPPALRLPLTRGQPQPPLDPIECVRPNFLPWTKEGGASAPPLPGAAYYFPRLAPRAVCGATCAGRETNKGLEGALSAGLMVLAYLSCRTRAALPRRVIPAEAGIHLLSGSPPFGKLRAGSSRGRHPAGKGPPAPWSLTPALRPGLRDGLARHESN